MKKLWLALVVVVGAGAFGMFHHGKPTRVAAQHPTVGQHCSGSYLHVCGDQIVVTKLSS